PVLVALTAWLAVWLLCGFRDAYGKRLPVHFIAAFGLLLGMSVGAAWEYVEFLSDWFGDANLQKSNADTMTDLFANNTGAFIATLLSLRQYPRWLQASDRRQAGQLATWLAQGPSRLLDRQGALVGGLLALLFCGAVLGALAMDAGVPPVAAGTVRGSDLAFRGLGETDPPTVVLAGDWTVEERGTCRLDPDRPPPGSERMGLLQIAPGLAYGLEGEPFRIEARVFEERPGQLEGTQMDAGLVFGLRGAGDFYLVELSALHDVLRLDHYVHNRRRDVRERLTRTRGNEWHTLHVQVERGGVVAGIDGRDVFSVAELPNVPGGVGLWARATAASCFGEATVRVGNGALLAPRRRS
ncbi:MAG: hypothetical protein M3336_02250, partial [Chloroflexota bacterium]|nr:hypothetical protein [Chloroflexota bacterium]